MDQQIVPYRAGRCWVFRRPDHDPITAAGRSPAAWPRIAGRQLAIFVNGLAGTGPAGMPGPAVTREDIETAFAIRASPRPSPGRGTRSRHR